MASLSLSQFLLPPSYSWNSKFCIIQFPPYKLSTPPRRLVLPSRRVVAQEDGHGLTSKSKTPRAKKSSSAQNGDKPKAATSASAEESVEKKKRGRKSKKSIILEKEEAQGSDGVDGGMLSASEEGIEKTVKKSTTRKARKKVNEMDDQGTGDEINGIDSGEDHAGSKIEKKTRGRSKKKVEVVKAQASEMEATDVEGSFNVLDEDLDDEEYLDLDKDEEDDISLTYRWPPLVCCFGAAQHAFVPSGRPAKRLIDSKIHERYKDAFWEPENFVRAPGGCAGSVATALAALGGRVAFMGKVGDDEFGQSMLYYLNVSNVQTRAVAIDSKKQTAVSKMKIVKRGGLRTTTVKTCAEDSLTKTEINIDVLREAKMFYLSTSSLLDQNMRKTTLRALRIAKKLGNAIFFDLNLSLALWQSSEETKGFIQQVWNMADFIEVTSQELEFLCGITPSESSEVKGNHPSNYIHHDPDVIAPLWHENLKVLFVTNGTSKLHYYTKEQDGFVIGMEDAPVTPYTAEMSASGDGIVAALMRMLVVQPHLSTNKGYLEHTLKYALNSGVIDQWIQARQRGFPVLEGMEQEAEPDKYGITSLTEREFRTVAQVS